MVNGLCSDNACPVDAIGERHEFIMANFTEPTICDVCRKLLRGVFYQGYRCLSDSLLPGLPMSE